MTPSIKARHVYTRDKDLTVAAGWYLLALGAVGEPQSPWGGGHAQHTPRRPAKRKRADRICIGRQKTTTFRTCQSLTVCPLTSRTHVSQGTSPCMGHALRPDLPSLMGLRPGEQSPPFKPGMAIRQILAGSKSWSYGYEPTACPQCERERTSPHLPLPSASGRLATTDECCWQWPAQTGHLDCTDQRPQTAPNPTGYSHLLGNSVWDDLFISPQRGREARMGQG